MSDDEYLAVESSYNKETGQPVVLVNYEGQPGPEVVLSVTQARSNADAIYTAIGIAEAEGRIYELVAGGKSQGFGSVKPTKAQSMAVMMLQFLRESRPPLTKGLTPIFGAKTQQPLVECSWYTFKPITLACDEARDHANTLISAAEASESDRFLWFFLYEQLDCDEREVRIMIHEFSKFRQRNQLEDLFKRDEPI